MKNMRNNDGLTKTQRWRKNNPIVYRASMLRSRYIREDRKYGRIGNELPQDYVTLQDVIRLITKKCTYFDECGTVGWRKIGLNRKDNDLPHIKSNVEPCCKKCNDRLASEYHKELFSKPVYLYTLDNTLVKTYTSTLEAANDTSISQGTISNCCNGGYFDKSRNKWHNINTIKGYKFSYEPL